MATNLSDLIAALTVDQIRALLLSLLQEPGKALPVTDWADGSFGKQTVEMEAVALEELVGSALPKIIGGGFVDLADADWIGLKAKQDFNLDQLAATFTVQTLRLTCAVGAGPYTINTGDLWAQSSATGHRYNNSSPPGASYTTSGTLTSAAPLDLQFRAESPGSSFIDPTGSINKLITTLAGVTVVNQAPDFTPVAPGTSSSGTVTASRTSGGVIPTATQFLIRIDTSGSTGVGAWSYSTNGGVTWTSGGALSAVPVPLPGGTSITFANGAGTPSFIVGDTFSFATPGSPIVAQGRDLETRDALAARCKARWPGLSDVPTRDKVQTWAFTAAGALVNRARTTADTAVAGQIDVTLAGPTGGVSVSTIATVRDYILARLGIGERVLVTSATAVPIPTSGTVFASAARIPAAQQAAQTAWLAYLASSDIADTIRQSRLEQIIMDALAGDTKADVSLIALTGGTPNIALTSAQVATADVALATALTWIPAS